MSREERKLRKGIAAHASRELKKELIKQKKVAPLKPKQARERLNPGLDFGDDFQDEPVLQPRREKKEQAPPGLVEGLVVETGAGFCDVLHGNEHIRCKSLSSITIGDRVRIARERARVEQVLPRRTALSRPDPHNPNVQRVIAANVDVVVNVVALKDPPLRPGLIDRYLIAIEKSGAQPVICVNKVDLLENDEELAALHPYQEMGVPVILCSAATGAGIDTLADALAGRVCVFSGHSGVGKSSILNALQPELDLATRTVSDVARTGRHTTTMSSLYPLPNGAMIIDTPGIREFGLWDISAGDVRSYFKDLAAESVGCAFSDCAHSHEPDCAVKDAVAAGRLSSARYQAYRRILESL